MDGLTSQMLADTRRALHGVAELVLAGPQYAATGRIDLRVVPGGFATVLPPDVRLVGVAVTAGDVEAPVDGRTPRLLAAAVGLQPRPLDDVYRGGPGVGVDEVLRADRAAAREIVDALVVGEAALRAFAPDQPPVLWPEHFDVAVTVDQVNYGVSPGDEHLGTPYAYVGPWPVPDADDFWDQPFGAARPMSSLADETAVRAFFEEGRARLGR